MFPEKSRRQFVPELGEGLIEGEGFQGGAGGNGELLSVIEDVQEKAADLLGPDRKVVLKDEFFHIFWSEREDDFHGEGRLLSFNKGEGKRPQLFPVGVGGKFSHFRFIGRKIVFMQMTVDEKGVKGRDRSLRQKKAVEGVK